MILGQCALCEQSKVLIESHIVPRFLVKWRKREAGSSRFRVNSWANMVVSEPSPGNGKITQDGPKLKLLCKFCDEVRIGRLDAEFAKHDFKVLANTPQERVIYGRYLYLFCVSLFFRSVHYCRFHGHPLHEWEAATRRWQRLLLGDNHDCSDLEQHLICIKQGPVYGEIPKDLPTNWVKIMRRGIILTFGDVDTPISIVKVGNLVFVAYRASSNLNNQWTRSRVYERVGVLGTLDTVIPTSIFQMLEKARVDAPNTWIKQSDNI